MTDPADAATKPLPRSFLDAIEREIMAGLPREQERRAECLRAQAYYQMRGAEMIPRRDAESTADWKGRPKRSLPFTPRVIKVLCSKLYAPGPARSIHTADAATKWLESAYQDCLVNSLWQRADRMSHLHGLAAFQVAATGDPLHPLTIQLWSGRNEIIPYEAPGKCNVIAAVVTIDCVDEQTRYTFWTPDSYRVYRTEKLKPGQTAGGRTARFVKEESDANPYGVLPFSFAYYELPTCGCEHVRGLGSFLADLNETIDVEMSDMANAVRAYHSPLPVAYDCDVQFQPILGIGRWIRVNAMPTDLENAPTPRLEYIQALLDIAGGWTNIRGVIDAELEALGIPLTAYRMESATLPSGAALVAEQAPLVEYAIERREPFRKYEDDLKTVCLAVGGAYYSRADLTAASTLPISLTWPPASIDLPGPDRDAADQASMEMGFESRVMIVMRRFGMSRDQAIEHLQDAIDDETELTTMREELTTMEADKAAEAAVAAAAGDQPPDGGPPDGKPAK